MELLRAGEALLRPSQPLLPFLAPAASRQRHRNGFASISQRTRHQQLQYPVRRTFAVSARCRQPEAAAAKQQGPSQNDQHSPSSSRSRDDEISNLLDETLDLNKPIPGSSSSMSSIFGSPAAQANNSPSRQSAGGRHVRGNDGNSSLDDIFNIFSKSTQRRPQGAGNEPLSAFFDPLGNNVNTPPPPPTLIPSPVKLDATCGRTVNVDVGRGIDVGRAFRQLEITCARNAVKRDFMKQRFHERPGMKRKRLKSERWRRRFKEGFKETVKMVQRMKKQGW